MNLSSLLQDPPPAFVFELSEAGIAMAHISKLPKTEFKPLMPGTLSVSPLHDNVLMPDELAVAVRELAPANGSRKRREAALILPDYCARVAVLDFDSFPTDAKEQLSLVRFRLRKSVPFDIESAAISYWPQQLANKDSGKKFEVVAAVAPVEIIARYEAPFRAAGLSPGLVTTSSVAMLQLVARKEVTVVAKLSGHVLALLVVQDGLLKLSRCLELQSPSPSDIAGDLYPTMAFVEDQLSVKAELILLCGFGAIAEECRRQFHQDLAIPVESLTSPLGAPGEHNAGLLGYLYGSDKA